MKNYDGVPDPREENEDQHIVPEVELPVFARETPPLALPEGFLTEGEAALIGFLRTNGLENNPDFLEYVTEKEKEIDEILNPYESQRARELFDIRKALIVGTAGNLDYAKETLYRLGQMAQESGDTELEDAINNALDLLDL
jgi:hypothetical protein